MQAGQKVTVLLFGGSTAERRVISDKGKTVVICSEEEFQAAKSQGRPAEGLGFPREDVLDTVHKKEPRSEVTPNSELSKAGD